MRTFTLPQVYVTLDGRLLELPVDGSREGEFARSIAATANEWSRTYFRSLGSPQLDRDAIRMMVERVEVDLMMALDAWRIAGWNAENTDVDDLRSARLAGHAGSVGGA